MTTHAFKVSLFSLLMEIQKIINPWKFIKRRGETSSCYGHKISGDEQSLLTETAICIVDRWAAVLSLSAES